MTASTAAELIEAGDLDGAIEALNLEVRQNPADTARRSSLAELLCFAGNFERADRLLDALQHQDPGVAVGVALFRHLIRGEEARQQFYAECRLPEFLEPPADDDQLYLKALVALKDKDAATAAALLADAEARRAPLAGKVDGVPFADLRDLDDVAAAHFDVLTSTGKFFWIPMRRIEGIKLHAPERRRDLLWRRATVSVAGSADGEVFLPTIYAPVDGATALQRLGRATDFLGAEGEPVRGVGLKSFLFGEEAKTILEISEIEIGG
jgi:type VI secretion system protein ImpE